MKGFKTYIIGCAVLIVVYLLAQYYKPKPTDWTATYLKEDKIPFGSYLLHEEIGELFPGTAVKVSKAPVYNTLKNQHYQHAAYLFVAGEMRLDSLDCAALVQFMEQGNQVFIASFDLGKQLTKRLKGTDIDAHYDFKRKNSVPLNFVNPEIKAKQDYVFDKRLGDHYFRVVDTSRVTILGKDAKGKVNFVKYSYGKGALFILPNPTVLTNYGLLNTQGADYTAKALSYLGDVKTLIWDENNTRGNLEDDNVLRVIFRHDLLRWAYLLTITGILLFVFFEMKRRQRIIPVIEPLKNTSLDFVKVVGKVYYQQRDNKDIALKKISYFLEFVRDNYRLKTHKADMELQELLILKSGVAEDVIKDLFIIIQQINGEIRVQDDQLITLNKLTEQFYKEAR